MDNVLRDDGGEIAADGSGNGLEGVGGAHYLAHPGDRIGALDDHRNHRAGRDELDELGEERLLGVLRVVLPGEAVVDREQLHLADVAALGLYPADDLADEPATDAVGFDHHEGLLHLGHGLPPDRELPGSGEKVARSLWTASDASEP